MPGGYVFVEERRFLDPVRRTTIIVNNTVINQTVINEGPRTAVIEQASGRKMQTVPVRQLRSKEEAKVVARHPAPTSTREKAVPPPVRNEVENARPVREAPPRQVEKPVMTTPEPQPRETKNEVHQTDRQNHGEKPDEVQHARQENVRAPEHVKGQPIPAGVEAKPEAKPAAEHTDKPVAKHEPQPEAKVKSRPVVERPAAAKEPVEQKAGKDNEKKD
jgi:hypothetical protein